MRKSPHFGNPNLAWAKRGADAFKRLGLDVPELYVCPLCLHGFTLDCPRVFTREHVPPAALGGSRLVITCRACNQLAGGKDGVDTHASAADEIRGFAEGNPDTALRARLYIESAAANVNVQKRTRGFLISGLANHNPPGACEELREVFNSVVESRRRDWTLRLSLPVRFSDFKQRVSWLRTRYLASFAALGYRFIFRSLLDPVREQIRNPDRRVISFFHFFRSDVPSPDRFILLVQSPDWARGVLVQVNRHYTMLPFSDGDERFYERLEEGARDNRDIRITGKLLPWPRRPEHLLDFAPAAFTSALVAEMQCSV